MTGRRPWVVVAAGEVSGDRFAAPVVEALRRRRPDLGFFGAGGEYLRAAGVELRHHVADLAVTGLTEAVGRFTSAATMLVDLARETHRRHVCLALLVDYPGLNLRLATVLRRMRVPVLYYVAPQRWAWLGFRTRALARCVDRLAVTLPFEERWFRGRGVAATFVGHPLIDLFEVPAREETRAGLNVGPGPVLALLPGSRPNEIERHLPLLVETLRRLPREVRPLLVTSSDEADRLCRTLGPALRRVPPDVAWAVADVALCAAGTATLEAALAGVPAVVFYRLSRVSHLVARFLVRTPHIALPNLLLQERLLPELVQDEATPQHLEAAVRRLLDPHEAKRLRAGLGRVRDQLGSSGVAERVADLGEELFR
jgi:lipid-A-disaccharide synthase